MTQIEKLKARLATAIDPAQRQAITNLIRTLEAAPDVPDASSGSEQAGPGESDPRLRFLSHEQAKFWAPIILGKLPSSELPAAPDLPCARPILNRAQIIAGLYPGVH